MAILSRTTHSIKFLVFRHCLAPWKDMPEFVSIYSIQTYGKDRTEVLLCRRSEIHVQLPTSVNGLHQRLVNRPVEQIGKVAVSTD